MGNENSHLSGLEIDEKSVEVSDFWSQHSANIVNSSEHVTNLTVLIGELFVNGTLWTTLTPLEKNSKNLMIYRHPCIIKYISSWKRSSKFHLALEEIKPLAHVLSTLNTLQLCMGLHSILKALCFLHEKAQVSHNNVCTASIYVTKDGSWKLGGMEYLCSYTDLSTDYLNKSRTNRYSKSIDPNEEKNFQTTKRKDIVDVYAYGTLVCEVLKSRTDEEIPTLSSFREVCKNDLQNVNVMKRTKLSNLLEHPFFNHDFISIHSFLIELPLKSDQEKTDFFKNLCSRLREFDEALVASQLGGLLLSRMVLLNTVAQEELLPNILNPSAMFSEETFKKYLVPKLLEIFCVRDAQIRLLLLNHFNDFMHCFSEEELQSYVLPELLVGIKDTNDHLVAVTLRKLADLVTILGSATVIGGKRAKLFNDGRPITVNSGGNAGKRYRVKPLQVATTSLNDSTPTIQQETGVEGQTIINNNNNNHENSILDLPLERPRPDGEEGETSTEEIEQQSVVGEEELDNWEDWDLENHPNATVNSVEINDDLVVTLRSENEVRLQPLPDINELDIKNQINNPELNDEEFNFFQDMEPVIQRSSKFVIEKKEDRFSSKLNLNVADDVDGNNEAGWGDDDWE